MSSDCAIAMKLQCRSALHLRDAEGVAGPVVAPGAAQSGRQRQDRRPVAEPASNPPSIQMASVTARAAFTEEQIPLFEVIEGEVFLRLAPDWLRISSRHAREGGGSFGTCSRVMMWVPLYRRRKRPGYARIAASHAAQITVQFDDRQQVSRSCPSSRSHTSIR